MNGKKLRFCMITTFYPPYNFGGDGIFVHSLSNELAKRGHQVDVIHSIDAYRLLASQGPKENYHDHANVTVHGLTSSLSFLSPLATQQMGLPLFQGSRIWQILEKGFDVIHYHNISLVGGPKILQYGQAIKLYTLHEYWLICPTHTLFKFNREACIHKQCLSCTLIYKRPPQLWRYTDTIARAIKEVDLFIAPSEFIKNRHLEMGLEMPIVELPYFTSRWDSCHAAPKAPVSQRPYFLFVGRLEKIKGLQQLLPIFRRFRDAHLWVVGTGAYEEELRRIARGSSNIKFLGYQSGEQLRPLYEQAVAVIVPSLWYEVFGIVILEAFATATPVLVSNRGGMPKIIQESGGGFVFNTEEELIAIMERLLRNQTLRRELGLRGYEAFQSKWQAEIHINRYLELIEQTASSSMKKRSASSDEAPAIN